MYSLYISLPLRKASEKAKDSMWQRREQHLVSNSSQPWLLRGCLCLSNFCRLLTKLVKRAGSNDNSPRTSLHRTFLSLNFLPSYPILSYPMAGSWAIVAVIATFSSAPKEQGEAVIFRKCGDINYPPPSDQLSFPLLLRCSPRRPLSVLLPFCINLYSTPVHAMSPVQCSIALKMIAKFHIRFILFNSFQFTITDTDAPLHNDHNEV